MRKNKVILWRLIALLFTMALLVCLLIIFIKKNNNRVIEKEGVFIEKEEACLLFGYLCCSSDELKTKQIDIEELQAYLNAEKNDDASDALNIFLTKSEAIYMIQLLHDLYPTLEGELTQLEQQAFLDYSGNQSHILATDFLEQYQLIWQYVHPDILLSQNTIIPIGYGKDVQIFNEDTSTFNEIGLHEVVYFNNHEFDSINHCIFAESADGLLDYQQELYRVHTYLFAGDIILCNLDDVFEPMETNYVIQAAFVVSNQPNNLLIEYKKYRIILHEDASNLTTKDGIIYDSFENIADIYFQNGHIDYIDVYTDYISGKLLCISDDTIELEGVGTFSYDSSMPVYKLYGEKEYYTKGNLKIGYDFNDFILDRNGCIIAALVTREESMDNIRVVIKTSGFASAYHETIDFTCDSDFLVNDEKHLAGDTIHLSIGDDLLKQGRVFVRPETNTAKTTLLSIERSQGTPEYLGDFEISETDNGILIINELPLEEYLYYVVPSEMPASYPKEALKSQAISARTYAYDKMLHSGLQSYGAHVDDSAAFQVYNNIRADENTTIAIRETKDCILTKDGKPAEVYYYSTSCGFGTDIDVWHSSNADRYRYMVSKHISTTDFTEDITSEEVFRNYITNTFSDDYEASEGWYRWTYDTELDIERVNQNLSKRCEASAKSILSMDGEGQYVQMTPPQYTSINRMEVVKRENGGVIDELIIEGPEGKTKIIGEHNVRTVLANKCDHVIRANGSNGSVTTLLPSAFAVIDVNVDESTNTISSYHVIGGGFGHGIGLSQNGARAMAEHGLNCNDILQFFFEDTLISEL